MKRFGTLIAAAASVQFPANAHHETAMALPVVSLVAVVVVAGIVGSLAVLNYLSRNKAGS
ncbi:MAG: hypothetical protein AAFZ91_10995 [Pseudomonadota bacterium]